MGRFLVVNFIEEGSVAVVPDNWERSGVCFWPRVTAPSKIRKMVLQYTEPEENWLQLEVKVLYSAETYDKAHKKLKKAEYTSDLTDVSIDEGKRSKSKNQEIDLPACPVRESSPLADSSTNRKNSFPMYMETLSSNEVFQRKVFKMLEEIRREQRDQRQMLESLSNMTANNSFPEDCPPLPINTPEGLAEFNEYLSDKTKFSQICSYFGSTGGFAYTNVARRILQNIMTNNLSLMYNWKGTGGVKLGFSLFQNIIKVIKTSVRQHTLFEKVTDMEIENAIKKWLVYAKDREGGRSSRNGKQN